ncbi:flagellar biosynthesis protein FlhF [Paenibacillus sp. FSL H8-0548]|uniref:flagellar biosynthesis protein FlhF n=1 Tax=Paenibacillus sp. FSL H8-0548 TaxID=1920422 RepID=UPI00096ED96D|nr:flagellar biosynthesis protein FlhF [Paenibacillus sp. FSL H8-0548]OMF36792.1 flagellar biosynthesis protein FlhF [Paenibacillus sp. FSL H8-0548]
MRVKRYIVNALPEAVSMIRSELGKDAVILNTKEIKVGGFMGMFRKKKVEVIAAIESNQVNAPPVQQQRVQSPEVDAVVEQILQTAQRKTPSAAATAVMEPIIAQPVSGSPTKMEREQFIIDEIRDLREYMIKLSKQQSSNSAMSVHLIQLQEHLSEQEMDVLWIERLLQAIIDKQVEERSEYNKEQVWEHAGEQLEAWLRPYEGSGISSSARVVHFVGPTGVGKTTTIAKLAAEQTIKKGRKVGFITSDTYRIAAVDQLRTYANILNVPIEVVFSQMDLPRAMKQLAERDLIYMDTAGRNFRSELHVSEVNSLLQSSEPSETILVLSMTGKTRDMAAVAEQFCKYGVQKVLFTKLDETSVYGAIFNLIMNFELLPTYLASGQTVPDDIEKFQVDTYIQKLLRGNGS